MGHATSQESSVSELFFQFLTKPKVVVYFPYVEYIGTVSLGSKVVGNIIALAQLPIKGYGF